MEIIANVHKMIESFDEELVRSLFRHEEKEENDEPCSSGAHHFDSTRSTESSSDEVAVAPLHLHASPHSLESAFNDLTIGERASVLSEGKRSNLKSGNSSASLVTSSIERVKVTIVEPAIGSGRHIHDVPATQTVTSANTSTFSEDVGYSKDVIKGDYDYTGGS